MAPVQLHFLRAKNKLALKTFVDHFVLSAAFIHRPKFRLCLDTLNFVPKDTGNPFLLLRSAKYTDTDDKAILGNILYHRLWAAASLGALKFSNECALKPIAV